MASWSTFPSHIAITGVKVALLASAASFLVNNFIYIKIIYYRKNIKYVSLQGNIPLKQRTDAITQFQTNPDIKVCFISLMSSAEGINLVSSNHLVLVDSWWNNAKMIQVMDRIHRIGQTHYFCQQIWFD